MIKCCRFILQSLWNCTLSHEVLIVDTLASVYNWMWCSKLAVTWPQEWLQTLGECFLWTSQWCKACSCRPLPSVGPTGKRYGNPVSQKFFEIAQFPKSLEHFVQLCMDLKVIHIQHFTWWTAISQGLRYVHTFDHLQYMISGFIVESLGSLVTPYVVAVKVVIVISSDDNRIASFTKICGGQSGSLTPFEKSFININILYIFICIFLLEHYFQSLYAYNGGINNNNNNL